MAKRLIRCLLVLGAIAAVLAILEGGFNRWLLFYCAAWMVFAFYGMVSIDDDLARERFHPPEAGADRLSLRAIRLAALAHVIVGALDAGRWHLTPVPAPVRGAALAGMLIGGLLIIRRVWFEETFLKANLAGYTAYTTQVGYRLIPGVW